MNAYELATGLENHFKNNFITSESALLLRQQADRIAELEKRGKPVAWMSPDGKVSTTEGILFHIPLYTTPQTKPLSDEEIGEIYWNLYADDWTEEDIKFARAILRKARD